MWRGFPSITGQTTNQYPLRSLLSTSATRSGSIHHHAVIHTPLPSSPSMISQGSSLSSTGRDRAGNASRFPFPRHGATCESAFLAPPRGKR